MDSYHVAQIKVNGKHLTGLEGHGKIEKRRKISLGVLEEF